MLIYQAVCITHDPEIDNSSNDREIIGIFSELEYAQNSFDRQERRESNVGTVGFYISKHECFRGKHEVYEYELDAWRKDYKAHWIFDNNAWKEYRIRK